MPTVPRAGDTPQLSATDIRRVGRRWSTERARELLSERRPLPPAPDGHEYVDNPWTWVRDVKTHIREVGGRADRVNGLIVVAEMLAHGWHPVTVVSTPGHDRIAGRLECSERTVTRLMRVMEERSYIVCTGPGRTITPDGASKKLRAEYALLRPKRSESFVRNDSERPSASSAAWTMTKCPRRKGERHAAAAALLARIRRFTVARLDGNVWAGVSAAAIASVCRPFFAAGWSPADVLHAIDFRPNDGRWSYDQAPRSVIGWLTSRLSWWLNSSGSPRKSQSQRVTHDRQRARVRAHQRSREETHLRAVSVPSEKRSQAQLTAMSEAKKRGHLAASRTGALGGQEARTSRAGRARSIAESVFSTGLNVGPSSSQGELVENPSRARAERTEVGTPERRPANAGRDSFNAARTALRSRRGQRPWRAESADEGQGRP